MNYFLFELRFDIRCLEGGIAKISISADGQWTHDFLIEAHCTGGDVRRGGMKQFL